MIQKGCFIILNKFVYSDYDLIFEALRDDGTNVSFFVKSGLKRKLIGFIEIGNVIVAHYIEKKSFIYLKDVDLLLEYNFSFHKQTLDGYYFFMDLINIIRNISRNYSSSEVFLKLINSFQNAENNPQNLIEYYNDFMFFCLVLLGVDLSVVKYCDEMLAKGKVPKIFFDEKRNQIFFDTNKEVKNKTEILYNLEFKKKYLQNLFVQKISSNIKLNF